MEFMIHSQADPNHTAIIREASMYYKILNE